VRVKTEGNGGQVLSQNADLVKQVADLEAHLNSSSAAEKSMRKAQDHHLAIEMDKIVQQLNTLDAKLERIAEV